MVPPLLPRRGTAPTNPCSPRPVSHYPLAMPPTTERRALPITESDASALLGCSAEQLERFLEHGLLRPKAMVGGIAVFDPAEIERLKALLGGETSN